MLGVETPFQKSVFILRGTFTAFSHFPNGPVLLFLDLLRLGFAFGGLGRSSWDDNLLDTWCVVLIPLLFRAVRLLSTFPSVNKKAWRPQASHTFFLFCGTNHCVPLILVRHFYAKLTLALSTKIPWLTVLRFCKFSDILWFYLRFAAWL